MTPTQIAATFTTQGLNIGRMVGGSKTGYRQAHPNNEVYFNANIFTEDKGKIWYGDLDLTKDLPALQNMANELNTTLYVLREMDGRFGTEQLGLKWVKSKAVSVIQPK